MNEPLYYLTPDDLYWLARAERRRVSKGQRPRLTGVRLSRQQEDLLREHWDQRKELAKVVNG